MSNKTINSNVNVNDIKLTDDDYNNLVNNLNDFIVESEKIMLLDRNKEMFNQSSYEKAFPSVVSETNSESSNIGEDASLPSESLKILESLPINSGDKGVLQAIESAGLLRRFHDNTITKELVDSTLMQLQNYPPISEAVSHIDNTAEVNVFSLDNGTLSINYNKLLYHSQKLYDLWERNEGTISTIAAPLTIVSTVYGYKTIVNILERTAFPKMYNSPAKLKELNVRAIEPARRASQAFTHNVIAAPLILVGLLIAAQHKSLISIETNININNSNDLEKLSFMGIFSRLNSYWITGILALSIYILKILNPSIFSKLYLISISQYLLFWTIWILFVVFYYIFILYALYRGHVKMTLGVDPVMDDKSSKFIPKFIVNHYNQWHNLGSSNYIPYFEMFFRSLMVAIGIVSINILICIVLSFY